MLAKRIIPCLDVKAGRVVKGTNFVFLRDAGDPVELAAQYEREQADELTFLDITASVEGRKAMLDVIERTPGKSLCPLQWAAVFPPWKISGPSSWSGILIIRCRRTG